MNKDRLNKVKQLAARLHFGQKRSCGADYITHPIAVAEIAAKKPKYFQTQNMEVVLAICYLHDVIEDCEITVEDLESEIKNLNYSEEQIKIIIDNVCRLTRISKEEDVVQYILDIKSNYYARLVKICDLEHNMSNLKPSNLLDKYKLCYNFLTQ